MIVDVHEFNEYWLRSIKAQPRKAGNQGTKHRPLYKDLVTAFDIETTRIKEIEQSIMYIWQWQFGTEYTVVGRTWEEFTWFCEHIKPYMKKQKLVVYVHNLSYEFQFLRGIYNFSQEEVFAMDSRKILKCEMYGFLEFRCSYLHSNMNLKTFTEQMGAEHSKLSGEEFDYDKVRYPWTPLTDKELQYCVNDVLGLVEALMIEMKHDGDNLYSIPLTSTGFVRRDCKRAMAKISHYYVPRQLPNYHIYQMLRESFRGGNTHANHHYSGQILHDVYSYDRSSSYPDVLVNCEFPVGPFHEVGYQTFDQLMHLINERHKAVVMRVRFYNIKVKDGWGCPYLGKDKCRNIEGGAYDNGRVLMADYLETTINDIDLKIILKEYEFDSMESFDVAYARYGKLPPPFIKTINHYYELKTILKGDPERELDYFRAKQKLNSLYGMCAQDPVRHSIVFADNDFYLDNTKSDEQLLEEYNKHAFVCYQWGCWCTALARLRLEEGIDLCQDPDGFDNFIYCDTDSVKCFTELDLTKYNNQRMADSLKNGSYAVDSKGITHYMGVFEYEGKYSEFATLGAKKYCYREEGGPLKVTIAGVIKSKGAKELEKYGGIKAFKPDFIFKEAGGVEAVYNDDPEIKEYEVDGHKLKITSNVVLRESTYTLGITWEYERLLRATKVILDF